LMQRNACEGNCLKTTLFGRRKLEMRAVYLVQNVLILFALSCLQKVNILK